MDESTPSFAAAARYQGSARNVALSNRPYALAINRNGVMYAPRLDAASAARFDLPAINPSGHVSVGTIPTDVSFDRTGGRAFVSNQGGSVSVIDVATNTVSRTIPVRDRAFVSLISPDDELLYIGSAIGSVYVYDLDTGTYTDSVTVGDVPQHLTFHPDGVRLYVSMRDAGRVVEIDTRTNAIVRTFSSTYGIQEAVVAPDGCELYVANQSGWLEVWNLGTGAKTDDITLGNGPWALAMSPDRSKLYAGILFSGEIAVINRSTRVVEEYIDVGGTPRRIKFAPDNATMVIANEAGYITFIP
jgi:YVTN family beta-propeller protein